MASKEFCDRCEIEIVNSWENRARVQIEMPGEMTGRTQFYTFCADCGIECRDWLVQVIPREIKK